MSNGERGEAAEVTGTPTETPEARRGVSAPGRPRAAADSPLKKRGAIEPPAPLAAPEAERGQGTFMVTG